MLLTCVKKSVAGSVLLASMCSLAMADNIVVPKKGPFLSLGGAYNIVGNQRDIKDTWAPEIGLGYRFDSHFSVAGIYANYHSDYKSIEARSNIKDLRVDGFYDITPWNGAWTPYVLLTVGHWDIPQTTGSHNDTRIGAGVGLRKAITSNLSFNTDVRGLHSINNNQMEGAFNVGLTWTFGTVSHAAVATTDMNQNATTPVEADAPKQQHPVITKKEPLKTNVLTTDIIARFAFDSDKVTSHQSVLLTRLSNYLKSHPTSKVRLIGYTDSKGSTAYNENLSLRRAQSIRNILINEYDIKASQLEVSGKGATSPIADNRTAEGRHKNRRVISEILS